MALTVPTLTTAASFLYTGTQLSTTLTTSQSNLTFNTPLSKSGDTVSIDLSLYDTISARNTALTSYWTTGNDPNNLND